MTNLDIMEVFFTKFFSVFLAILAILILLFIVTLLISFLIEIVSNFLNGDFVDNCPKCGSRFTILWTKSWYGIMQHPHGLRNVRKDHNLKFCLKCGHKETLIQKRLEPSGKREIFSASSWAP